MDAFDADVLIYLAQSHPRTTGLRALIEGVPAGEFLGMGSVMLLPELMTWPVRHGADAEIARLNHLLARLELRPLDVPTADLAVVLGAQYGLRAPDAVHLATAVMAGADRFITGNSKDFPRTVTEIDVVYPEDLG